jgi:hypothetical protein
MNHRARGGNQASGPDDPVAWKGIAMSLLKPIALAVIASLVATPALAEPAANPAAKLSLTPKAQPARTASKVRQSDKLVGTFPLILLGTAAIVGVAVLLGTNDHKAASM